jgi:putative addiction module killer protein
MKGKKRKKLVFYRTDTGKVPFQKWLERLKDQRGRALIKARLDRLAIGHYGDYKHIENGVYELRIAHGPGYRVYFGEMTNGEIVLLLAGGTKRTQKKDIEKALAYWHDIRNRGEI